MSLVICSNQVDPNNNGDSQFQSAFSFHNHLTDTMTLPPNSEVAVQSVKINKKGTMSLPTSTRFGQYFGQKLTDVLTNDLTTSWCKQGEPVNKTGRVDLFPEEVASAIQVGMNTMVVPDTAGEYKCKEKVDATTLAFKGFDFTYTEKAVAKTDTKSDNTNYENLWSGLVPGSGLDYDATTFTLTSKTIGSANTEARAFDVAYSSNEPIALKEGVLVVDLNGAAGTNWAVGLSRSDPLGLTQSAYFIPDQSDIAGSDQSGCRDTPFDFVVGAFQFHQSGIGGAQRYLRAYHMVKVNDNGVSTKEVNYYDNGANPLAASAATKGYNWSTNAANANYRYVKLEVVNEKVIASISVDKITWVKFVDPDLAGNTKSQTFKPVGDTCRFLYPRYHVISVGANNNTKKSLVIDEFYGREGISYAGLSDWWAEIVIDGDETRYGLKLDSRYMYDMTDATLYTHLGLNADGLFDGYTFVVSLRESVEYISSVGNNVNFIFGFPGDNTLDTPTLSGTDNVIKTYSSEVAPPLESNTSIFVALKNINVKSFNAGKGTRSQILYSCPKFDNAGLASGQGLYYEPNERLYIKCNNSNNLVINDFDIDLVNENETLADDLVGKSVVILHFRPMRE